MLTDDERRLIEKVRGMDSSDVEREPGVAFDLLAVIDRITGEDDPIKGTGAPQAGTQ